jgi:hypothetical protein
MGLCDHIREDAFECNQKATWVFSLEDEPNTLIRSCSNHIASMLPRNQASTTYYLGDSSE